MLMFLVQLFIVLIIIITDEQLLNINIRINCQPLLKLCYKGIPDYSIYSQNDISDSESIAVSETITESIFDTDSDFAFNSDDDFDFVDKIKYE